MIQVSNNVTCCTLALLVGGELFSMVVTGMFALVPYRELFSFSACCFSSYFIFQSHPKLIIFTPQSAEGSLANWLTG